VIRIEAIWLAVAPLDMRAGTESMLARVVAVFGVTCLISSDHFNLGKRPPVSRLNNAAL